MQDICEEAALSPGAVYRYFRSKEELIEGISVRRQQENSGLIEGAMAKGNTFDALDELIRVFFTEIDVESLQATCALLLETIGESPRNERIRSIMQRSGGQVRGALQQLIRQSQAAGEFNPALNDESIARVMVALYHGFITQK